MKRKFLEDLKAWFVQNERKPLVIRGARQVGKTWIVRHLAKVLNCKLLELNFERNPEFKTLFNSNDPDIILLQISTFLDVDITASSTILFLDEIQAAPELLAKLRWFAEEKPELAVIATGSLLDFILNDHSFSMPVGRISYLYLEPLSFEEFLMAKSHQKLVDFLSSYQLGDEIAEGIHQRLLNLLREYLFVGGMPAAVNAWVEERSPSRVSEIHQSILTTYREDFSKYGQKNIQATLQDIMNSVPGMLGKKFKYSAVNISTRSELIKEALGLLVKARVVHQVFASAGNGIPIEAEVKRSFFKVIFLDVGLALSSMGLRLYDKLNISLMKLVDEGGIAEQLVGQLLRTSFPSYIEPKLYYWLREKKGSAAEIDYLIQEQTVIMPIEVKAGKTGALRSLHAFMKAKELKKALRFNIDYPSMANVDITGPESQNMTYQLLSLPFYLIEQKDRF